MFERVTAFGGWGNHAGGDEAVELAGTTLTIGDWGNKFRDNPPMGSDQDTFPGLNSPNVAAEVVLQFTDASFHCSHRGDGGSGKADVGVGIGGQGSMRG